MTTGSKQNVRHPHNNGPALQMLGQHQTSVGSMYRVNWRSRCCSECFRFWPAIPRVKVSIVGSLRDREVACSASDRQGSNFESCVWRTVSSQSSHHPQEVLLARFSLYVHKGGLKPDSFHFISFGQPFILVDVHVPLPAKLSYVDSPSSSTILTLKAEAKNVELRGF